VEEALRSIIPKFRAQAISDDTLKSTTADRENAKGAISSLLFLYFGIQKRSIEITTAKLLSFYGLPEDAISVRTFEGLFVKGVFPPIDFSNLIVTKSRFQGYKNLLACRFKDTKFMYSVFEDCAGLTFSNTELNPSMIDGTCDPGDLRETFVLAKATKAEEKSMIQAEATRFLHSFFRGDRFIDNKMEYIKFSTKVPGLSSEKFDRLLAAEYFHIAKSKTVAVFYEIAPDFKSSVRKFLTDGYTDGRMRKFIAQLQ